MARAGSKWFTMREDEVIRNLAERGNSDVHIAAQLPGRDAAAIERRRLKLRIAIRHSAHEPQVLDRDDPGVVGMTRPVSVGPDALLSALRKHHGDAR